MVQENYKRPRIDIGDLRTWVIFYEYAPNDGPEPGEQKKQVLYECFARVDEVWSRDVEQAKANNTLSDLTITIRDPLGDYIPRNVHYLEIEALEYADRHYQIREVQPDLQNRQFTKVIAEVTT
jgi:hypothetical protein